MGFINWLDFGFFGHYVYSAQGALTVVAVVLLCLGVAICGYFLGSINFAIIISGKKYKEDIREHGSKNAGMTNMMRTYGKKAAGLTLLGDALKAVVACAIGYILLGRLGAYIGGLFCITGHVFPIFYRFKGGKGVITAAVTILMCEPFVFPILFLFFILIVLFTKYVSLASIICTLLFPIMTDTVTRILTGSTSKYIIFGVLIAVIVVAKHWTNIQRLMQGKESKFSFKKSVKEKKDADSSESNDDKGNKENKEKN